VQWEATHALLMQLRHLSAAPILKHPDQEEEAEGSVPVTVLEDVPWDFRARG